MFHKRVCMSICFLVFLTVSLIFRSLLGAEEKLLVFREGAG